MLLLIALTIGMAAAVQPSCPASSAPPEWDHSSVQAPAGTKALVTGGAGFIGSHVARRCVELGMEVVVLDDLSGGFVQNLPDGVTFIEGDIKDSEFISRLMEEHAFDLVYHLAAYAAEGLSHFIRSYNYANNVVGTANLITQSVRSGSVKRFVFTSSIAVYGEGQVPFSESISPEPEDPYGIGKFAIEMDLKAASSMFGLEYVVMRPHNVYGPGQNMYDKYRNVVGIFMNQLRAGEDLTVFGDGTQTRCFSYIDDVSLPIALSGLVPHARNQVFNVGGRTPYTLNELARTTLDGWHQPEAAQSKILYLPERHEVKHAESSHEKIDCFFPNLPSPLSLEEGMARTIQWALRVGKDFKPVEFKAVELKANMPPSWMHDGLQEVPIVNHTKSDNLVIM
eukprot:TRINITY_DN13092_c0_g2_i2.p1 TRINITY_DN13092_c0_g2~~TRINITY_DN13092_c0_g2_i2.p1  ORF type:complete len:395 (-),score=90.14 TRINITY_DN13092_c0_g2_i2:374-1558(-)